MNENRPNLRTATPEENIAGDMICFVVGNKLCSAGVSIKLSEKGSVKQTSSRKAFPLVPNGFLELLARTTIPLDLGL